MKKFLSVMLTLIMLFATLAFGVSAEDGNVARMWICAEKSTNSGIGHVFLYFENLTNETITVGRYSVEPYGDVSVGSFGTEGPRGAGVYYNNETALTHYNQLVGLSTNLDAAEIKAVNSKISNYNRWDPIFNCNYFALLGWNAGSDSDIPFLIFPAFTRLFITMKGGVGDPYDPYSRTAPVVKQNEL